MAGLIPGFSSGSTLVIRVGETQLAHASNLSFVDDVSHAAVGGIGSFSYDAIEPTQYVARGSFSLQRYSSLAHSANLLKDGKKNPTRSGAAAGVPDGNSMLWASQFNPSSLLLSKTFDIQVFEKEKNDTLNGAPIFTIRNCRMTGYSIGFTPGQVVSENISFTAILIEDNVVTNVSAAQITL